MEDFQEWLQARVYNVMDGLLVLFGVGASAFFAALAAGAVILPLGIAWEALNPELAGTSDYPVVIYAVGAVVFGVSFCAAAGHAFTSNGLKGFSRR